MKAQITHYAPEYVVTLTPECDNELLLLQALNNKQGSPFKWYGEASTLKVLETDLKFEGVLGHPGASKSFVDSGKPGTSIRVISKAGKKKIAKAQKKRWAKFRALGKTPLKPVKKAKKTAAQLRSKRNSKASKGYWARMTPAQRKAEVKRRKQVASMKKAQAVVAPIHLPTLGEVSA